MRRQPRASPCFLPRAPGWRFWPKTSESRTRCPRVHRGEWLSLPVSFPLLPSVKARTWAGLHPRQTRWCSDGASPLMYGTPFGKQQIRLSLLPLRAPTLAGKVRQGPHSEPWGSNLCAPHRLTHHPSLPPCCPQSPQPTYLILSSRPIISTLMSDLLVVLCAAPFPRNNSLLCVLPLHPHCPALLLT